MTSEDIRAALRKAYPFPQYAFLEEVRDAAGFGASRSADALAVSLWPSRGLTIEGFEIKVDRRDWLNELKSPEKAEVIAAKCSAWWIVTPEGIVKPGELPTGWGHIEVTTDRFRTRTRTQAPVRPSPFVSASFLAALLKRAIEPCEELRKKVKTDAELAEEVRGKVASSIRGRIGRSKPFPSLRRSGGSSL